VKFFKSEYLKPSIWGREHDAHSFIKGIPLPHTRFGSLLDWIPVREIEGEKYHGMVFELLGPDLFYAFEKENPDAHVD
jgi:hypothetical protein